jgi:signal transduction histidine kinase
MNINELTKEELIRELQSKIQESEMLKRQLKQLNISLIEVNEKLTESEAMKSHFISNISNEIVNPFTSILALADNVLGVEKENWKKVISMVSIIHTEVFNLDFQLKNIFTAAKLESGEIYPDISNVNVTELVNSLISSFKYETRHKNLTIEYTNLNEPEEPVLYFKTDAQKLHLLLCNLIGNAIKFSYEKGIIKISSKKGHGALNITVQDYGQGISKTNEQIIFDRFKKLDNGINTLNRGHGLGLSIVKALVDILDGKISFKSELGKGTIFSIFVTESTKEVFGTSVDADEILFNDEKF